ncbi:MAG: hypothetical protein AYL32_006090 [Candidatus Bathyarchaeota archaeon B26-2]|nr:MAG: hypothetical protein AYL32_006090 [Candidatus Bathyarchaeota archaeon B26-2]
MDKEREGILLSVLTSAMGFAYFCNKKMLLFLNVETSTFLWFSLGSLFYLSYILPSKRRKKMKILLTELKKVSAIAVFTGIGAILWFQGTVVAQPTNVAFIFQFSRVFTVLAGILLLGERLSPREGLGVLLALTGGFILTYTGEEARILNNLVLLASASSYAASHILAKIYVKDVDPISLAAGRTMLAAVLLFFYSLATGRLDLAVPLEALSWALLGAFIAPFLAVIFYYEAFKRVELSKVAAIISTQPFFTALYAVLFFATLPSLWQMVGGSIVTLGVMVLTSSRRSELRSRKPDGAPRE